MCIRDRANYYLLFLNLAILPLLPSVFFLHLPPFFKKPLLQTVLISLTTSLVFLMPLPSNIFSFFFFVVVVVVVVVGFFVVSIVLSFGADDVVILASLVGICSATFTSFFLYALAALVNPSNVGYLVLSAFS